MTRHTLLFALASIVAACTSTPYETGDGRYSNLHAQFVEARSAAAQQLVSAEADDGSRLVFQYPHQCTWAATPDSIYRALLYYTLQGTHVRPVSATKVYVLHPQSDVPMFETDPVNLQAAWISRNHRYLNLRLQLLTGQSADTSRRQTIGIIQQKQEPLPNGGTMHHLSLAHSQNGIPQYVSQTMLVSIPLAHFSPGDSITLTVNTYNGVVVRKFP